MLRRIHVTNAQGRDADVAMANVPREGLPRLGLEGSHVSFRRYVAATQPSRHQCLQKNFGADYANALIDDDPEVDLEREGRTIAQTSVIYLDSKGEPLTSAPRLIETLFGADGAERERREPRDVAANVNEETALRWTGRKIPVRDAVRQYCFRRTIQLFHVDGLTFDFLHAIARQLHTERVVVLLGAGPKGNEPLIFEANGRPYRGFLSGRLHPDDPNRYRLLLHLSDMELKAPVPAAEPLTSEAEAPAPDQRSGAENQLETSDQLETSAEPSEPAPSTHPPASPAKLSVAALLAFEGDAESDGLVPLDLTDDEPPPAPKSPRQPAKPAKTSAPKARDERHEPAAISLPPARAPRQSAPQGGELAPTSTTFEPAPATVLTGVGAAKRSASGDVDRRARNAAAHAVERESADVMVAVQPPRRTRSVTEKASSLPQAPAPSASKAPAAEQPAEKLASKTARGRVTSERSAPSKPKEASASSKSAKPVASKSSAPAARTKAAGAKSKPAPAKAASSKKAVEKTVATKKVAASKTKAAAAVVKKAAASKATGRNAKTDKATTKKAKVTKTTVSKAKSEKGAVTNAKLAKPAVSKAKAKKPATTKAAKPVTTKAKASKPAASTRSGKPASSKLKSAAGRATSKGATKPRKGTR